MIEPPKSSWPSWAVALVAMAAATFVRAPAGAAAGALVVALWLVRRPAPFAERGRRRAVALVALVVVTLVVAAIAELAVTRRVATSARELQASHDELWSAIERAADRAATSLGRLAGSAAERRQRFALLRSAAADDAGGELNLLLWDRYGDLEAWWGPGLLPDVAAAPRRDGERRVVQSVLSTTLYVVRRFRDGDGTPWSLVAAESFAHAGAPPIRGRDRPRWRGAPWSLAPVAESSPLRWELRVEPAGRRLDWLPLPPRLARCAIAVLLLWLALAGAARAQSEGDGSAAALTPAWLAGGAGAILLASGAGVAARGIGALAAALATLALAVAAAPRVARLGRGGRYVAAALGAAVGPALLLAASRFSAADPMVGELALLAPTVAAMRAAAVLTVLAAWAVGWRLGGERTAPEESPLALAAVGPAAVAALAALLADYAYPAAVALALAGGGVAVALALGRHRTRAGRLAVVFVAALLAAAAWSAGARQVEMRRLSGALARLLPPPSARVAEFAATVERQLAAIDPSALLPARAGDSAPEDLAFALWQRTALVRGDVLSALAVVAPDGARAIFSSGLPIDPNGRLDLSPTRWIGLAPGAWLDRRAGGESAQRDRRGRTWVVEWQAVPLPGFDAGAAVAERSWPAARPPLAPAGALANGGGRAVLYESGGRIVRSPWAEGTPALDPALVAAPPFRRYSATPDGPARAAALAGEGYAAAVFLPLATPFAALERAGSFVVGALLPALAFGIVLGLLAAPWARIGGELAHAWRSYSTRLVLVFSAFLLLPVAAGSTWVAHAYARRLERQQEASALDALHSAQRILGEYVLSLEPGFGVGTAVDDRLLEWLARVVRSEVHLYWGSELYASSKRDLFAAGLLPARLSGEIWQRIHIDGERVARRTALDAGREAVEIYAPLEIPGLAAEATKLVLALPRLAQQDELVAEVAAIRRRAFLTAAALALLLAFAGSVLARRFTRPIEEIVRGTQRIAEGAPALGYEPEVLELEALAVAIDRMAAKVAEARERLLVEKRLVERIAENVTAAVVGLDGAGRVVFANRLARDRVRAAPGESLRAGLQGAGLERVLSAFDAAARTAEPVATRIDRGDGERDWTLVRVPLPGPGEPSELVVVEDVTDVVRAQRLDAWAGMARIIAHEIKNPLTPIRLSAEHLREAWARDREHFAAVFERCTDNILRQVEELRQTASEFSLYSEIPRIDRRAGELREAIGEIVEAYRAAPPAGVEIVFDAAGPRVAATFDRRLLGRAVRNLIENAVRASADGGRVEIEVEERPDAVAVRVLDDGPGVPAEMVARVVEPYFSTQSGGTGLGLPIARRVAEEHGGGLAVRNRPSGGFEVTITIPRA